MVGKGDIYTVKDWLYRHVPIFEKLVIIDGSHSPIVEDEAARYDNVHRLSEDTLNLDEINDQTLRAPAMKVLGDPIGRWIMVCHVDEFWTIDPRSIVKHAGHSHDALRVRVLTASPLESEYKEAVKRLDTDRNYLESFHMMDVSNLVPNFKRLDEMLSDDSFSSENKYLWKRHMSHYLENRFFRWNAGMRWDGSGKGVIPAHNPGGKNAAPFRIKGVSLSDFSSDLSLHAFAIQDIRQILCEMFFLSTSSYTIFPQVPLFPPKIMLGVAIVTISIIPNCTQGCPILLQLGGQEAT